ncbi:MAG: FecR family protein [Flavobacterium sp.]
MDQDYKLAKWLSDEMTDAELKEFAASPEFETYAKIKKYAAELTAPAADLDSTYAQVAAKRSKPVAEPKVRRIAWLPQVAAILVIALGLTWFLTKDDVVSHTAANGNRTEFLLPDNSAVVLNAGSDAGFNASDWSDKREVSLNGEAFFKVAKGKTFDVVTPMGTVTVLGTQFNVKARGSRFEVVCYEGKVKVAYQGKIVYLLPGDGVAYQDNAPVAMPDDAKQQPGWMDNEATFVNEKPESVIDELERQYAVSIELPATVKESFTGTLPTNDLNTALNNFATPYHLKPVKKGDKIILMTE